MNPDFLDLLRALLGAEAGFLVVGAYAVGIHGRPRATKDLDAWVEASVIGIEHLLRNERAAGRPQDLADVAALERLLRLKQRPAADGGRARVLATLWFGGAQATGAEVRARVEHCRPVPRYAVQRRAVRARPKFDSAAGSKARCYTGSRSCSS
jgi:hypothetical protein